MSRETWVPRCPQCGDSKLVLAPANEHTKHALLFVEVYCPNCQWRDRLDQNMKRIYIRL